MTDEYLSAFYSLWKQEAPYLNENWVKYEGIFFEPNRRKSRTRPSGLVVRADRHCAAPRASVTDGTRSAAITSTCSTPFHGPVPGSLGCTS
jgi:hypothetical protein